MNSKNCIISEKNNVVYITYPNLEKLGFIKHASSTRIGGVSEIEYLSTMNLGYHTDDCADNVRKNFEIFASAIGIDINDMVSSRQRHNENIKTASRADCGMGITKDADYDDVDALVTNEKYVALTVFGADCVPILFADPKNKAIGAAHCGWRGTYKNLAYLTAKKMNENYGSKFEDIFVSVAPCIHGCCYEVDEKLFNDFKNKFSYIDQKNAMRIENGAFYLDLPEINRQILISAGVKEENILVSDLCTACNHTELFSHRKSNGKRGIMASVIEITD